MLKYISFLFITTINFAYADYLATGPFETSECSGFVIEKCSIVKVAGFEENGEYFKINKRWKKVDNYSGGRCTLLWGSGALGFLDSAPNFVRYDDDKKLVPVDADGYITFQCKKI